MTTALRMTIKTQSGAIPHDGVVDIPEPSRRSEVILVTHPVGDPAPNPVDTLRHLVTNTWGMATMTATTLAALVEQTVAVTVGSAVNAALDRLVPQIADAIIERIDLTDVVLEQVDLHRIVVRALDSLDLTEVVLERVDVNAIVEQADIDAVIDRVPILPLANYVIDEINLPQIIRDSTSGIAGDALNTMRRQSAGADDLLSRIVDRATFRKGRKLDAPGDPESLT
jgi:hypothetical protein